MAAPVAGAADQAAPMHAAVATVTGDRGGQPHHQQPQQLPEAGFDGILVAAVGTGLTGAGWLLMLTGSRRLRRRSR
jgi:predicted cobalt transporter CbtA